jgi:photosynthetic reaction center M subunit
VSIYENVYTQVQVRPDVPDQGVESELVERFGKGFFVHLAGLIGNAQIGPIYIGTLGVISLLFGFFAFEIIGLNMLASVHWNPIEFVRQLPGSRWSRRSPKTGFISCRRWRKADGG